MQIDIDAEGFDFDLSIDRDRLDQECLGQAERYFKASVLVANARAGEAAAKNQIVLTMAEVENAIRLDPAFYGIAKITENSVEAAVNASAELKMAQNDYIEKRRNCDYFSGYLEALEQRKRMLTELVELHGRNYFSEPAVSGVAGAAIREKARDEATKRGRRPVTRD